MSFFLQAPADVIYGYYRPWAEVDNFTSKCNAVIRYCICQDLKAITVSVSLCHRGGRMENINAWYLNTHMVYL